MPKKNYAICEQPLIISSFIFLMDLSLLYLINPTLYIEVFEN